jgi:pimeloyl-ACP methyl ester carboxylesterase
MRLHPAGLRSVILDAIVPPDINFIPEVPQTQSRAFHELFAACVAAPACNESYPDLEQVFYTLTAKLNREPARIRLTDPKTNKTYQAVVDGDTLESALFQLLYASEIIPALPVVIYQARDGDYAFLSRVLPLFVFDRTIAVGMYNSVICSEDADFTAQDVDLTGVRSELADTAMQDAEALLRSCAIWGVPELDAPLDAALHSDVPTLLFNGRFDPITPPSNGEHVAASLVRSYNFVFGSTGHGALATGPCPEGIARAFLNNPAQQPDGSCAADQTAPTFVTPKTVAFTRLTTRVIDALDGKNLVPLVMASVCLVPLLSLLLIWPIVWLVRALSNQPQTRAALARPARWAAVLAAILGAAFLIGIAIVVLQAAFGGNEIMLLFGLPANVGWLAWLPWAVAALAAVMVVSAVAAWLQHYWPVWERIYYTLLTVAAVGAAAGMVLLIV